MNLCQHFGASFGMLLLFHLTGCEILEFCTFASGSSGNSALISCGNTHILIDAGISARRITASLREFELEPSDLSGILITHEHTDHVSGLKTLIKYVKAPVFASRKTSEALVNSVPCLSDAISPFESGSDIEIGEILIHSFRTPHDTPESVGYRLCGQNRSIAFVTDLGCVPEGVFNAVSGADAVILEANHDIEMLRKGSYPVFLKKRILGDRGHLSNDASGELARRLVEKGTKKLLLAHLSRDNNLPELAYKAVDDSIRLCGALSGRDFSMSVAPRDTASKRYELL